MKSQSQSIRQQFNYENSDFEYTLITSKSNVNNFIIIIMSNESKKISQIEKCLRKKKKSGHLYFFKIPSSFIYNKETLVMEFLKDVLGKKKLSDKEMNVIVDENYFNLYEEIRIDNKGKYKSVFLNKIHKLNIVKRTDCICDFFKD